MVDVIAIAAALAQAEKRIRELEARTANMPVRLPSGAGGGGGSGTGLQIYSATVRANLPTDPSVPNGAIGVTTSTNRGYRYVNGAWICDTHVESS